MVMIVGSFFWAILFLNSLPLYKENWIHWNLQQTPQILLVDDVLLSLQILTLLMDNLLTPSLISLSTSPNLLWHHEKDNSDTHPAT